MTFQYRSPACRLANLEQMFIRHSQKLSQQNLNPYTITNYIHRVIPCALFNGAFCWRITNLLLGIFLAKKTEDITLFGFECKLYFGIVYHGSGSSGVGRAWLHRGAYYKSLTSTRPIAYRFSSLLDSVCLFLQNRNVCRFSGLRCVCVQLVVGGLSE